MSLQTRENPASKIRMTTTHTNSYKLKKSLSRPYSTRPFGASYSKRNLFPLSDHDYSLDTGNLDGLSKGMMKIDLKTNASQCQAKEVDQVMEDNEKTKNSGDLFIEPNQDGKNGNEIIETEIFSHSFSWK